MKKSKCFTGIIFMICFTAWKINCGQISPFNERILTDTTENFCFLVSGHFHGASTHRSPYPASTLLANIDTLNSMKPAFLMSLGDMFVDVNEMSVSSYRRSLFAKLRMPLFNAVGNHDLSGDDFYGKVFGKTWDSFSLAGNVFIILNTEADDGRISGDQLNFFKETLLKHSGKGKNLFVFSHRPVWAERKERYKDLFEGNTRTLVGKNNFTEELEPLLLEWNTGHVYWISGSMASAPASFFYDEDPETGIIFMQTALRDLPRDAVLKVSVRNGEVSFQGISLTGQALQSIESYGMEFWKQNSAPEEKFSFRLLPYLILQVVSHSYFWIGVVSSLLIVIVFRFILLRWKRKR
jgi:hypothetical protein